MSELQFRIIFLVCSVTVLAAILLYCRRLRRMSSTSSLWQYNSSPVLYNVDVIPSTDKIPVRWPNEKKLRRDFEKSDMTIKMFLCKERRSHFVVFWLMWHQPESASDRMAALPHHPLVLGHANLVPRRCDPFEESEKKIHIWLAEKRIHHIQITLLIIQTIVIRGDWLWKAANINDKNNSAAVYVGSTLKVHNPLFSVGKLLRNKLMQRFYWSIQSKW